MNKKLILTIKKLVLVILFVAILFPFLLKTHASDDLPSSFSQQISLTFSGYHYQEPSMSRSFTGTPMGAEYLGIYDAHNHWSVLGAFDFNTGSIHYQGLGTINKIPQYSSNIKAMVGYHPGFIGFSYIGIGTRFLHMQANHRISSMGHWGCDLKSTYHYIPIGFIHRLELHPIQSYLEITGEYDYFLEGNQFNELSVNPQAVISSDLNTKQTHGGYGINLSILYKKGSWGFGPYFKYWNINQSEKSISYVIKKNETQDVEAPATYTGFLEVLNTPPNSTYEYGIKLTYSF